MMFLFLAAEDRPSNKRARPALGWSDFELAGHNFYWLVIFYLCVCTLSVLCRFIGLSDFTYLKAWKLQHVSQENEGKLQSCERIS